MIDNYLKQKFFKQQGALKKGGFPHFITHENAYSFLFLFFATSPTIAACLATDYIE